VQFRHGSLATLGVEPPRPAWVRDRPGAWRFALGTVCIGAFMGQLDASIVTTALPTIQHAFGASVAAASWVGLSYLVALVACVTAMGRLADVHGRKLVYLYGFAVFVAGSALCAFAGSLDALVAFRALQGVGAAMLQANSVAIIALAVPPSRLGRALGVQGAAQALGLAAGPSIGGLLVAAGGWRLLFLANVPAGVVAFALGWYLLPRSTDLDHGARFDRLGFVLLVPTVAATLCVVSLGGVRGLGGLPLGGLAAAAVLGGVGFLRHERRARSPLVDLAVIGSSRLGSRLVASATSYVVLFGTLLAAPFLLERALHAGVVEAGATLAAMPVAIGVVAPVAGRAYERTGPRPLTVAGMALCSVALLAAARFHATPGVLAAELVVLGAGIGLFTPANNASTMASVPRRSAGEASGLLNTARGLGTAVGLALATLLLSVSGSTDRGFAAATLALAAVAALTGALSLRTPPT
jgi:EmrB/QacA subfamily drug resistance transporter